MDTETYRKLAGEVAVAPLSALIPQLLMFAQEAGHSEAVRWARLELGGYFQGNSALSADVIVPEYRIVAGQYSDQYGRPLVITDSRLSFISEYRLRYSVAELERMKKLSGLISIEDPKFLGMLRDQMNVEVNQYSFSPSSVSGVLSGIRTRLIHWVGEVKPREVTVIPPLNPQRAAYKERGWLSRFFRNKTKRLHCLHPIVINTASKLYEDGHYRQAVLDTYIALVQRVKEVSGRFDLDNSGLMQFVFGAKDPVIVLSDDPDERLGFIWLFTGAVMGVRNPKAHRLDDISDPDHAFEWLAFSSALFRLLDGAKKPK
jgi:uncharacterized protein (TIGR02391 family)